jgi:hypothetical protein
LRSSSAAPSQGRGVAIYAKPSDQQLNSLPNNDIRLDAHDLVLMIRRDGAISEILETLLLRKSSAC